MKIQLLALLAALSTAGVSAQMITFTDDMEGSKGNGWTSVHSSFVRFSDTIGTDLILEDFGVQSDGQALAVYFDDASGLRMDFAGWVDSLQLSFGNDEPGFVLPGDSAVLELFLDGTLVGTESVVMNGNDRMDQTIAFSGAVFNQAIFTYHIGSNHPGLIEVVDNIRFTPVGAVPEPSTYGLLGALALVGGLMLRLRRKTRAA